MSFESILSTPPTQAKDESPNITIMPVSDTAVLADTRIEQPMRALFIPITQPLQLRLLYGNYSPVKNYGHNTSVRHHLTRLSRPYTTRREPISGGFDRHLAAFVVYGQEYSAIADALSIQIPNRTRRQAVVFAHTRNIVDMFNTFKTENPTAKLDEFSYEAANPLRLRDIAAFVGGVINATSVGGAAELLRHGPRAFAGAFPGFGSIMMSKGDSTNLLKEPDFDAWRVSNSKTIIEASRALREDSEDGNFSGHVMYLTQDCYVGVQHDMTYYFDGFKVRTFNNVTSGQHVLDGVLSNYMIELDDHPGHCIWAMSFFGKNKNWPADVMNIILSPIIGETIRRGSVHYVKSVRDQTNIWVELHKDPTLLTAYTFLSSAGYAGNPPLEWLRRYFGPNVVFKVVDVSGILRKIEQGDFRTIDSCPPVTGPNAKIGQFINGRPTNYVQTYVQGHVRPRALQRLSDEVRKKIETLIDRAMHMLNLSASEVANLQRPGTDFVAGQQDAATVLAEKMSSSVDVYEPTYAAVEKELLEPLLPRVTPEIEKLLGNSDPAAVGDEAQVRELVSDVVQTRVIDKAMMPEGIVGVLQSQVAEDAAGKVIETKSLQEIQIEMETARNLYNKAKSSTAEKKSNLDTELAHGQYDEAYRKAAKEYHESLRELEELDAKQREAEDYYEQANNINNRADKIKQDTEREIKAWRPVPAAPGHTI